MRVPVEKLFHVDGTPREAVLPCAAESAQARFGEPDPELGAAVALALRPHRPQADADLPAGCLRPGPAAGLR